MKRMHIVMVLIVMIVLSSCAGGADRMFLGSDEKIADETFSEIVIAIQNQDSAQIAKMFARSVKSEKELQQDASILIDYIRGEVVSVSAATEKGVGADYQKDDGKGRKEIQSSFYLETTQTSYYVAIKECVINDFDNRGVGVIALHIIEVCNWKEEYVYRGDGSWTPGIVIDTLS